MRPPVIVAAALAVVALAATAWLLTRPSTSAPEASRSGAPAAAPAAAPAVAAPAPAPDASSAPRVANRPAVRTAEPPAAPATPVVEEVPTTGTLRIETDVPDALVLFDRIGVGTAPVTIPNVAPGEHRLNVSAKGYDGYAETIQVEPGVRVIRVAFKEVRLEAHLNAVHKHGMGSCRGELSATPQGVQFTASDGKDNFSVRMADIETLEVDYLAKNLRLRVREGRTYNFGDPDDNADRLFVFHRDVDAARQRLTAGR